MRILTGLAVVALAFCLTSASAVAGPQYEVDYADYDATITDKKGVTTDCEDFGYWTGPNILVAKRGDAQIEMPFRRIRTIEIGDYVPVKGHSPAVVTTRRGKKYDVQIERFEGERYLGGSADFGTFRIRLGRIKKLELGNLSHTEPERGPRQ